MRVMTVKGAIDPKQLGRTMMHEHILVDLRHSLSKFDAILDDADLAVEELRVLASAGGKSLVDTTNYGMGRNIVALKAISEASGVNIIAATGFYTEPYYPVDVHHKTTMKLADQLTYDLVKGIDGTNIRAGIIGEIGTGRDFVTAAEERVFRAAARAHLRTGAAITTHTYLEQLVSEQIDILEDEGVCADRIVIGHLGDSRNYERLRSIAQRGVFLEIDHIGMHIPQTDLQRARTIVQLAKEGYVEQLLVSLDVCHKSRLHWYGGTGYDYLLREFAPLLLAEGLQSSDLHKILVDNPAKVLSFDC